jgi:hypothetical protein
METGSQKVLCAQCHEPVDETNGGQLTSKYPLVNVFVHHSCKDAWLEANSGTSYVRVK